MDGFYGIDGCLRLIFPGEKYSFYSGKKYQPVVKPIWGRKFPTKREF